MQQLLDDFAEKAVKYVARFEKVDDDKKPSYDSSSDKGSVKDTQKNLLLIVRSRLIYQIIKSTKMYLFVRQLYIKMIVFVNGR